MSTSRSGETPGMDATPHRPDARSGAGMTNTFVPKPLLGIAARDQVYICKQCAGRCTYLGGGGRKVRLAFAG
jgi:hypothetical protein